MTTTPDVTERIQELFTLFKLPTLADQATQRFRNSGHDDALAVLLETLEAEYDERKVRRCERLLRASRLPPAKTLQTLDEQRLPKAVAPRLRELATGDFVERAANVLCFGLPGAGKTHAACALGHALVQHGHSVLFAPTFQLVQELLAANATSRCHAHYESSMASRSSSSTTSGTCSRARTKSRFSSRSWPSGMSAGPWSSRAISSSVSGTESSRTR
jgi:DNA replication protein DnaC